MNHIPEELFSIRIDTIINRSSNTVIINNLQYLSIIKLLDKELRLLVENPNITKGLINYLSQDKSTNKPYLLYEILKNIKVTNLCQQNQIIYLTDIFYYAILRFLTINTYYQYVRENIYRQRCCCFYCKVYYLYKFDDEQLINTDLRKIIPIGRSHYIKNGKYLIQIPCCLECYLEYKMKSKSFD